MATNVSAPAAQAPISGGGYGGGVPSGGGYYSPQLWGQIYNQAVGSQLGTLGGVMGGFGGLRGGVGQGYGTLSQQAQHQAQQTLANQQRAYQSLGQGYGALNQQIAGIYGMGGANGGWGVAGPAAQAIAQNEATGYGNIMSNAAMSGGLGNSATQDALRQNQYYANQSYHNLGAQLAQLYGGAAQNIGLQRLGAQQQGIGANTAQANLGTGYGVNIGLAGLGAQQGLGMGQLQALQQLGPLPYPNFSPFTGYQPGFGAVSGGGTMGGAGGSSLGMGAIPGNTSGGYMPFGESGARGNLFGAGAGTMYAPGGSSEVTPTAGAAGAGMGASAGFGYGSPSSLSPLDEAAMAATVSANDYSGAGG